MRFLRFPLIATTLVLAALTAPGAALGAVTDSVVTSPASPAFVTFDADTQAPPLHVTGTTQGSGNVDLRCYFGTTSFPVKLGVPVAANAFALDVPVDATLMNGVPYPYPYCLLRAVPAGTVPADPPGTVSAFAGPQLGWGWRQTDFLGSGFDPNPATAVRGYFVGHGQSRAFDDFDSIAVCGLCDTFLYGQSDFKKSNPIWWTNADLQLSVQGAARSAARVDGVDVYEAHDAWYAALGTLGDNAGFPKLSFTDSVDPATGDVTIDESDDFVACAPQPAVYPPTDASCTSFAAPVVRVKRHIVQTDDGRQVAIVDHWQSLDGESHQLDAIYDEQTRDVNSATVNHESLWNFSWTADGFTSYLPDTTIAPPPSGPATVLLKTDGSTPDAGDGANPIGALTYGTPPTHITLVSPTNAQHGVADWQERYERTVPATGELTISQTYSHDFVLTALEVKAAAAEQAARPPSVVISAPADGASLTAGSATVSGSAASPDGAPTLRLNGVSVPVAADGSWSAQVPLADGDNKLTAVVSNSIGLTAQAGRTVVHSAAGPAQQPTDPTPPATPATPPVAAPAAAAQCRIPKLHGRTLAMAKRLLARAHCHSGRITRKVSTRVRPGRILASKPRPGSLLRAGTRVALTVAVRPAVRG